MTKENRYGRKYDDKECWDLAMSWGTAFNVRRLHNWHKENKGFGSHTGGTNAMWRYAARNPELCYPQYKKFYFERTIGTTELVEEDGKLVRKEVNPNISFTDFLQEILFQAKDKKSILSGRAYRQFCEKYGIEKSESNKPDISPDEFARILVDRYSEIVGVRDIPDDMVTHYALMVIEALQNEKNEAWKACA